MSPKSPLIAIIAGVGPGTGASVARKFSKTYPVVLLARTPESFSSLAEEINAAGGRALGIATDVSSSSSLSSALTNIKSEFGDGVGVAAAIFNASGAFMRKPFLEIPVETFEKSLGVSGMGGEINNMSGLGSSRWSSKPTPKSPGDDVKSPDEPKHIAVPSFGFTMPSFTKKSVPAVSSPVVSSSTKAKLVEMKKPAVKVDETPHQDLIKVETGKPKSKVAAAIQATRDQMAKIMGQRRQDRPSTANATIGRGPSASYGGYTRRDR
ncbi:hypothetical protein J4E89_006897 [Alternaria sp. Ai002NY15]|nr:hypothetical protein J4E89_006897 [Alternaria sp. Ai002NY15]